MYSWIDVIKNTQVNAGGLCTELPIDGEIVAIQVTGLSMKQNIKFLLDDHITLYHMPAMIQNGFVYLGFDASHCKSAKLIIYSQVTRKKVGVRVLLRKEPY